MSSFYCLICECVTPHRLCHKRVLDTGTWQYFPLAANQYLTRRRRALPVRQATCRTCETTWAHLTAWPTTWQQVHKQQNAIGNDDDDAMDTQDTTRENALCKYTNLLSERDCGDCVSAPNWERDSGDYSNDEQ
jgi:hypothetical protein